ncbi:MAG: glycosyltransferase, partial [Bacteroidetes bacterium]
SPALRNTLKYADVILPMNRSVAEVIPIADKRVYLIPSAGSETVPTPPERNGDSFRVISVGRFVDLKGFDLTLRAFGQMYRGLTARERENTHLFLVGKGPAKSLLEKILADEKIEGSVTFIDWIDRRDLAQLYRNSDVFCFPSHEGAGMVVPEAMSHGLPVVCLDNCGPGEFITPECGIAQPYKSYDETVSGLAAALTLLHRDKALRAQMSVAARAHFDARFDWRQKAVQLEPVYLSLLSQTYARQH